MITSVPEESMPVFGRLNDILLINNVVHFIVQVLHTVGFSTHFHAYVVDIKSDTFLLVQQSHLEYPQPVHLRSIVGLTSCTQKAVIMKYNVWIITILIPHSSCVDQNQREKERGRVREIKRERERSRREYNRNNSILSKLAWTACPREWERKWRVSEGRVSMVMKLILVSVRVLC